MLDVVLARELPIRPIEHSWLVDQIWGEEAVGVLGGEPKCCKSFLALDIAVAVASGRPCLRRFGVARPGRVLLFAAEDALWEVRRRLEGIARAAGVAFESLDIHVITAPVVRLDNARDREELEATVASLSPRLVVLDPFVRLHRVDENAVAEVAPLLAYLRTLQRRHRTAVLLVHHARKGGGHLRAGQALRGSSELHAWGDSNLYMRRRSSGLTLGVEHRNAASVSGLGLDLVTRDGAASLVVVNRADEPPPAAVPATTRIVQALADAGGATTMRQLREECRMRGETISAALGQLVLQGRVAKAPGGYRLVATEAAEPDEVLPARL
jgi:hypothetical protein